MITMYQNLVQQTYARMADVAPLADSIFALSQINGYRTEAVDSLLHTSQMPSLYRSDPLRQDIALRPSYLQSIPIKNDSYNVDGTAVKSMPMASADPLRDLDSLGAGIALGRQGTLTGRMH